MQPKDASDKPAPTQPPPMPGLSKNLHEDMLEPDEYVLKVVHRSVVGLVIIYFVAFIAIAAILGLFLVAAPDTFQTSDSTISGTLSLLILVSAAFFGIIIFTATYIYRQSRLLVTDRSLVQIMQKTLFIRKVSRLSMSNVEDVSEEQRGVLANIFNYGTLTVQTAGTMENFVFSLCPNPASLADKIIEARQAYALSVQEENQDQPPKK